MSTALAYLNMVRHKGSTTADNIEKMKIFKFMSNDKLMQLITGTGISNKAHDRSQLERNHDASTPLIEYHNLNDINHMKQIAKAYNNEEDNEEIQNICVSTLSRYSSRVFEPDQATKAIALIQKLSTDELLAAINESNKLKKILRTNQISVVYKPIS